MSHGLSNDQVDAELKKMVAFIKQEAFEKAREIEIKADEEFAIEKSKLVRAETAAIDIQYARKFKTAELSQSIARSNITNKTRLKVLSARQELLENLFESARNKLEDVAKDEARYSDILKNLVLEGMYALNEASLQIRGREKDRGLLDKAIPGAVEEYKRRIGKDVKITIDENSPVPEESHGGIFIVGLGGKITIDNTLEQRLRIIEADALPAVRSGIFGENPNRRFYD